MVPPPMSFAEITTTRNIIDCSISLTGSRIAVLTTLGIEVYKWDFSPKPATVLCKIASWCSDSAAETWSNARLKNILVRKEELVSLLSYFINGGPTITNYAIKESNESLVDIGIELDPHYSNKSSPVHSIFTDANHDFIWAQTATGLDCLNQCDISSSSVVYPLTEIAVLEGHGEHPNPLNDYSLRNNNGTYKYTHIFSLSRKGELFANDKLLARGCTSFVSTNAHLIFTTSLHLLKFVHLDSSDGAFIFHPYLQMLIEVQSMKCLATLQQLTNDVGASNVVPD